MINLRGDSPEEVTGLLAGMTTAEAAQRLADGLEMHRALTAAAPLLTPPPQAPAYNAAATAPSTPAYAPGDLSGHFSPADLVCPVHGPRTLAHGISTKTQKPWYRGTCAADRNCATVWGR